MESGPKTIQPEGTSSDRAALVAAAVKKWARELIDLGGRNTLLYYKDLKGGTLDLSCAATSALTTLLAGRPVPLSALYPALEDRPDARRRCQLIHKKVRELREERGISAGYLACGMATWTEPDAAKRGRSVPAAPVLLRSITLTPRSAAEDEFELELTESVEVNPVLLHLLHEQFAVTVDSEELVDLLALQSVFDPAPVYERLGKLAHEIEGFSINPRLVVGTFTYAKLPMVNDLQNGLDLLQAHDVVAALAGDAAAQQEIRATGGGDASTAVPLDHVPPQDEFLVADADSSQSYAINAIVRGQNLVIKGPPGTGKSQTITNLVATLIARGERVLFVAEKRAAIDAVLSRLERVGLGEWVMNLHDGAGNRRQVAQALAATLDQAGRTPMPQLQALHRDLAGQRERLLAHDRAMHTVREPWGLSVFDAQARLLGLSTAGVTFRLRGAELRNIGEERAADLRERLIEYADLGGLDRTAQSSPWYGAPVSTPQQAEAAFETVLRLQQETVPGVSTTLDAVLRETGLCPPATLAQWQQALGLLDAAAETLARFKPEVFTSALPDLIAATATRRWRKEHNVNLGWGERRRLRKQAQSLAVEPKVPTAQMHDQLVASQQLVESWSQACADGGLPRLPANLGGAHGAYDQLNLELRALGAHMHTSAHLESLSPTVLPERLERLAADQATLARLPRRNELEAALKSAGLGPLLAECLDRGVGADTIGEVFEAVWLSSILEAVAMADSAYGAVQGQTLDRVASDFRTRDTEHIRTTADRVRRCCAERLFDALDAHPEQATLIRAEANKQRRHRPMRDLLRGAPDVMMALKPCWAMSPLVVSQVLPLQQLFDVVIFDEASQVPPADAIPSVMRGKRVVVAGDEHQLPPTSFFASASVEDETEEGLEIGENGEVAVTLTDGYESILDSLAAALPFRSLEWHYRSQDERLIAFSNAHIYSSSLTTFPGAHVDGVLDHVAVPHVPGRAGSEESAAAEVQAVVDLVLDHARQRPQESLGVITMGIKHADRIETAIRQAVGANRDLDQFFDEDRPERFFVKNLERVQGDERDAIILSIGYGKAPDGRMMYRFGPLNSTKGGERRLNVAVSRAKRRMTLVSSFTHHDLDASKLTSRGAQMLGQFLSFMSSKGTELGSAATLPPQLNPFEMDVRDRLTRAGIPLTAQYGVSGYRIDFAAAHPTQPGRMVLAIEADGASYHSSATARDRDRLRQEHLERLGWRFHRIWSTEWFRNPAQEVAKAKAAYDAAVAAADRPRPAAAPPEVSNGHDAVRGSATPVAAGRPSAPAPERTGPRPAVTPGLPVTEYTSRELTALVRWITSDGLLRTEEDILREAMQILGFRRRGSRIDAALSAAIKAARG